MTLFFNLVISDPKYMVWSCPALAYFANSALFKLMFFDIALKMSNIWIYLYTDPFFKSNFVEITSSFKVYNSVVSSIRRVKIGGGNENVLKLI